VVNVNVFYTTVNKSHLLFLATFGDTSFRNDLPGVGFARFDVGQLVTLGEASLDRQRRH